jgi:alkanesulfonate monooxygenase SsuD/methylene tetrahydromethanopterin reductase-like flavin-dependent oxidoreductase (luciferase family)
MTDPRTAGTPAGLAGPRPTPRIGLFVDLRNPEPWRRTTASHLARILDVLGDAEQAGADAVWATEHHLFPDGYLTQPLTFLAAVAARTTRLRLGTAVLLAPLRHPRHIAEQAALVDAVSGGRLELGLGPGYVADEFAAYGKDPARRFAATNAAVRQVRRLLAEERLGPAPVQRPVPLWLGYQGPKNAYRAGRLGTGLLSLNRGSLRPYLDGLRDAGLPESGARMGGSVDIVISRDPERAWAYIRPHYAHQLDTYVRAHAGGSGAPPPAPALEGRFARDRPGRLSVRLSVLTPEEAVADIAERTAGLPVHHVYTWASIAGMPDDIVDEHVELLLGHVAPRLRALAAQS